jgi:hypothetical protein
MVYDLVIEAYFAIQLNKDTLLPPFACHCGDIGVYIDGCSKHRLKAIRTIGKYYK